MENTWEAFNLYKSAPGGEHSKTEYACSKTKQECNTVSSHGNNQSPNITGQQKKATIVKSAQTLSNINYVPI